MQYWLVKTEPDTFSWDDHVKQGVSMWDGVRNFAARNNLRAMEVGDQVLFYHSVTGKAIVGLSKVVKTHYPDPTATEGDWSVVDLSPIGLLKNPVTLDQVKSTPELADMALVRLGRLSVQPVKPDEFTLILKLGGGTANG